MEFESGRDTVEDTEQNSRELRMGDLLMRTKQSAAEESYAALATALAIELSTGIAVIDAMLSKRSLATPDLELSY